MKSAQTSVEEKSAQSSAEAKSTQTSESSMSCTYYYYYVAILIYLSAPYLAVSTSPAISEAKSTNGVSMPIQAGT